MIVYARAHTHTHTHTSIHTQAHTHMHSVIKFGPEVECVVLTRFVVVAHHLCVRRGREGGSERAREGENVDEREGENVEARELSAKRVYSRVVVEDFGLGRET